MNCAPPTARVTSQHAPSRRSCRKPSNADFRPRSPSAAARTVLDPTPPPCWSGTNPGSSSGPFLPMSAPLHPILRPRVRCRGLLLLLAVVGGGMVLFQWRRGTPSSRSLRRVRPRHHRRKEIGLVTCGWLIRVENGRESLESYNTCKQEGVQGERRRTARGGCVVWTFYLYVGADSATWVTDKNTSRDEHGSLCRWTALLKRVRQSGHETANGIGRGRFCLHF